MAQGLTGLAGSLEVLIGFRILLGVGESIYLPGGVKIISLLFSGKDRGLPSGLFDFRNSNRTDPRRHSGPLAADPLRLAPHFPAFRFYGHDLDGPLAVGIPSPRAGCRPAVVVSPARTASPIRWKALLNRNLLGICLGFFCFDYYWYVLVTWLPDYLVTVRHLSIVQTGLYGSLVFFTFGVSEPIGGWIADSLIRRGWDETRTRKGIVTVAFFMGLFLIAAMRASDTGTAIWLLIAASLVGLATGNLLVILQCCAPFEKVGIWTGAENFAGNLAGVVAPLAVGLLIKRSGSYVPGFELGAVVLLVGLLAYWFVVGELKPKTA